MRIGRLRLRGELNLGDLLDSLLLPRPYLYRDAPLMFGVRLSTKYADPVWSIDFEWEWS